MKSYLSDKRGEGHAEMLQDVTLFSENKTTWNVGNPPTNPDDWPDRKWANLQTTPRSLHQASGNGSLGAGVVYRQLPPELVWLDNDQKSATIRDVITYGLLLVALASISTLPL